MGDEGVVSGGVAVLDQGGLIEGLGRQVRKSFGGSNFDHVVVLRGLIMSRCLASLESDHVIRMDKTKIQPDFKKARYRKWRDHGAGVNDGDSATEAPACRFSHFL